jgi:hypothetical protein
MRRVRKKRGPCGLAFQDAFFALDAQLHLQAEQASHQAHQRFGLVGVELIDHHDPATLGILVEGLFHVAGKVRLAACGAHRGSHNPAGGHLQIGDQALRAVADVLPLASFDPPDAHRTHRMQVLQRLDAGLLIGRDQMHPLPVQFLGLLVQATPLVYRAVKAFRILRPLVALPRERAVGLPRGRSKKRPTVRSEIVAPALFSPAV